MKKIMFSILIILITSSLFAVLAHEKNKDLDIPELLNVNKNEIFNGLDDQSLMQMSSFLIPTVLKDSIQVEFEEVVMDFHLDTMFTSFKKLNGSTDGYQYYPTGVIVDPDRKIWIGLYGEYSREFERGPDDVIRLKGLHCFMPDGKPAPFSPIEFLEFPDGTKDTIYVESEYSGAARGLTMMDDGNILYTAWSTLYKIDYKTGEGLAMWHPAMEGFSPSSMSEPAYDPVEKLVFVGHVISNKPIYMLDEDLLYQGIAVESVSHLHRSIVARTKSDGMSQIFSGSVWNGQGIFVYESSDALFEPFELVDTIGNEVTVTDTQTINYMAWASCMDWYDWDNGILLYGNYMNAKVYVDQGEIPEAKHASKWIFMDVDEDSQLGSFGNPVRGGIQAPPCSPFYPNGSLSPRGASFYGNSIYTVDFDLNLLQKWTITSVEEPVLMNLSVSDSVDSTILTYGWAPDATNGFDVGLDEYDSVIAPLGSFDAHFSNNLIKDIRDHNYTDSISWSFEFRAGDGNGPVVLEWDSTAFPEYGEFVLKDSVDGSLVYLDMREYSSYVDTVFGPPNLKIVYTYQMSADFEGAVLSGQTPLRVRFTDRSCGNIRFWNWDFGDGEKSQDKNPVHTYTEPGMYCVTLAVSDGTNDDEMVKTDYITVTYSDNPSIVNIADAPDDQGGWVYVDFSRSYYDTDVPDTVDTLLEGMEMYTVEISENSIDWIAANSTVAYGTDLYSVLVHTLYDSSAAKNGQLNFRVVAGMTEGIFLSGVMTGYSVDNIAPPAPAAIMASVTPSGIDIAWDASDAEDIKYYNIYRSMNDDFNEKTVFASTEINSYLDNTVSTDNYYYYRITAVDQHDNEGSASTIVCVEVGLDDLDFIPENYELVQNYPNPFNPSTTLRYGLPEASDVKISIYNISGKKIMEWDMKNKDAGWHHVIWNGRDVNGNQVSTGMYIYNLQVGDFVDTKKMVFMK